MSNLADETKALYDEYRNDTICDCNEISEKLLEIGHNLENSNPCCPYCCDCFWEKAIEEAEECDSDNRKIEIDETISKMKRSVESDYFWYKVRMLYQQLEDAELV